MKPKVSIIIPVYNVEKYLEECIESIQNQTLKDIEIICVNDGSTDSSLDILKKLSKKDKRILIINQENAGAGAARNNGIKKAQGEYIGFVDSDDILYPTMYEELYSKASSTKADMVITGEIETFFNENIRFPQNESPLTVDLLELDTFSAIEYPEILQNVFLWNRIYSKSFWDKHQFKIPEGRRFAEDLLICTQTSVLANKIAYVEGPLYKYRNVRENSLSDTLIKSQKKMDYLIAVKETKDFLLQTGAYQFYAHDFLTFAVSLFFLLQQRITNMKCHEEFYTGMANILDEKDHEYLNNTWLIHAYSKHIKALKEKTHRMVCYKNKLMCFLHL